MKSGKTLRFLFLIFTLSLYRSTTLPLLWAQEVPLPKVAEATLKNGLRVLVLENRQSPTVAFRVNFKVGSVQEDVGKTGLAHLFEHMIFKGTKRINSKDFSREKPLLEKLEDVAQTLIREEHALSPDPEKIAALRKELEEAQKQADEWMEKDEYEKIFQEEGGKGLNAYTSNDHTSYVISLPANKLELWMAMESDRFQNPVLREFYRERDVVMEERRMNYESRPWGKLYENFITHAFIAHPYHNPGIGWMSDLKRLTRADAEDFFVRYYGPNNAVMTIVGDVDAGKTLEMAKKYFETVPTRPLEFNPLTEEPPQEGERRSEVFFDAEPMLMIGYHKGDIRHKDQAAFEMLTALLSHGRTSRFYKNLVEKKKLAVSVSADIETPGEKYPHLFWVEGAPRHPHSPEELERGIYEEIEKIKKGPISDWELQKVRNQLMAGLLRTMGSNTGMAYILAYNESVAEDWKYHWKLLKDFEKIKAEDIQRVAKKYLASGNRTVSILRRKK